MQQTTCYSSPLLPADSSRELEIELSVGGAVVAANTSGLHPSAPVLAFCGKETSDETRHPLSVNCTDPMSRVVQP